MEKLNITNIYDLLHILFDVLSTGFNAELVDGEFTEDTIKLTKAGSDNAMYIAFDVNYPTVINATVWYEPEGYHDWYNDWPIEGINWDTEDDELTPETIAADIEKQF